jgi:hypothetical protein
MQMGEIAITFRTTVFFEGNNFCDNKLLMCIFELNSLIFLTGKKFPSPRTARTQLSS